MVPEIIDLVKLIPNGASVIAVIVVVILFLKQQDKMNEVLKSVTDKFNDQTAANQKAYQDQIQQLSSQYYINQKSFQDQIQLLIDNHLKVSQQTVISMNALKNVIQQVQDRVSKLPIEHKRDA